MLYYRLRHYVHKRCIFVFKNRFPYYSMVSETSFIYYATKYYSKNHKTDSRHTDKWWCWKVQFRSEYSAEHGVSCCGQRMFYYLNKCQKQFSDVFKYLVRPMLCLFYRDIKTNFTINVDAIVSNRVIENTSRSYCSS